MIIIADSTNGVGQYDCFNSCIVPTKLNTVEGCLRDERTKDNKNNKKIFMVMLAHPLFLFFNVASAFCLKISIFLS